MKHALRRGAFTLAAFSTVVAFALGSPAMGAPARTLRYPTPLVTAFGGGRLIAEPDSGVPVSGVDVFVAAGLDREPPKRSGVAALVAECIVRTPIDGTPLHAAVAARGGSLDYTIDGRSVRFYIESRGDMLPALIGLLGRALRAPDFSPSTVAAARATLSARIGENEATPLTVGIAMFRQAYYAGPAGLPALGTVAGLIGLGPADLRSFYAATYVRGAVTAAATGAASPGLSAALGALTAGFSAGSVTSVAEKANTLPAAATRIVAERDIAAPWIVLGFAAPSPDSPDFGAMLVMESLLSGAFDRRGATTPDFAEKSVGALYLYDATPAGLVVYINGSLADPSIGLREVLLVAKSLASKPVDAETLARLRAAAEGQFLTDSVGLSDRAYLLGTLWAQGLGDDPINGALAALESTTPADLQRVAKRYLQRYIVALVLPRERPAAAGP